MWPLRALLVDVGGTLIDDGTWAHDRIAELTLARLAAAFGGERPWFPILPAYNLESFGYAAPAWEQRNRETVARTLREHDEVLDDASWERIREACSVPMEDVVALMPGACEAMRSARDLGLRIAICSNVMWRTAAESRRAWEAFGIGNCFDAHITSIDVGFGKPNPVMFERALEAISARPDEAAMLGDHPEYDIAGARALGLRTIWLRRPEFGACTPAADAELDGLGDLVPVLRRWCAG